MKKIQGSVKGKRKSPARNRRSSDTPEMIAGLGLAALTINEASAKESALNPNILLKESGLLSPTIQPGNAAAPEENAAALEEQTARTASDTPEATPGNSDAIAIGDGLPVVEPDSAATSDLHGAPGLDDQAVGVAGQDYKPLRLASADESSAGAARPAKEGKAATETAGAEAESATAGAEAEPATAGAAEVDPNIILAEGPAEAGFLAPALSPLAGAGAAAGAAVAGGAAGGSAASGSAAKLVDHHVGLVIDGYVKGATVFYDANGNGVLDAGEISTTTGADGGYALDYDATASGRVVSLGGTDILTGQTVGTMMAGEGSSVVTPLTTLLANSNLSEHDLKQALGIDQSVDLKTFDAVAAMKSGYAPLAAIGEQVFTVAQQVFTAISSASAMDAARGGTAVSADNVKTISSAIADALLATKGVTTNSGDASLALKAAVSVALTVASGADAAIVSALIQHASDGADATQYVSANILNAVTAVQNVSEAIATAYSGHLADDLSTGTAADLAVTMSNTALAQSALITAVYDSALSSGANSTLLNALTDTDSLANLAGKYSEALQQAATNPGQGVTVGLPSTVTVAQAGALASGANFIISDSAQHVAAASSALLEKATSINVTDWPTAAEVSSLQSLDNVVYAVLDGLDGKVTAADAAKMLAAGLHFGVGGGTVQASGADLGLTLANLEQLGATHVGADGSALNAALGSVDWDSVDRNNPLPVFDAGLTVTAGITDGQVAGALTTAHAQALHKAGVDIIDLTDNSITLTDAQAHDMIAAGLHFAADDNAVHVGGTVLQNSVADLQALGVDSVSISGSALNAALGSVDWNNPLPSFDAGLTVTAGVTDGQVAGTLTAAHALALHNAGVDQIHALDGTLAVNMSELVAAGNAGLTFAAADQVTLGISSADLQTLNAAHPISDLQAMHVDILDLTNNGITLTDAQAHDAILAGLHFAADDSAVAVHAGGTHLQNSVHDLQSLGVDVVDGLANGKLVVNLGDTTLENAVAHGLPQFDPDHNTHIEIAVNSDQIGNIDLGKVAVLQSHGVDAIDLHSDPLHGSTDIVTQVELAGSITETTAAFEVTDELAKALLDAGLLTSPEQKAVTVDVTDTGGHSALSLVMMGDLGVDHVQSTSADMVIQLGFNPTTHQDADINDLVATLSKLTDQMFDNAKNVELDLGHNLVFTQVTDVQKYELKLLGIDTLKDDATHGGNTHTL